MHGRTFTYDEYDKRYAWDDKIRHSEKPVSVSFKLTDNIDWSWWWVTAPLRNEPELPKAFLVVQPTQEAKAA